MSAIGIIRSEKEKSLILSYVKSNEISLARFTYKSLVSLINDADVTDIVVASIKGLALEELLNALRIAKQRGVTIHAIKEKFVSDSLISQFTINVLKSLGESGATVLELR